MKISFCTQVLNRAWQLDQVVHDNLRALEGTQHEWVVLDLGSTDGLELPVHPNLRYYRADRPEHYHIPRAKNRALRLGRGEYLFSLDADNYLAGLPAAIEAAADSAVHSWDAAWGNGTFGRIGAPRDAWEAIGYFPENVMPAGIHDGQALRRLAMVCQVRRCSVSRLPIQNTKAHTTAETGGVWDEMQQQSIDMLEAAPSFLPRRAVHLAAGTFGRRAGWAFNTRYRARGQKEMRYTVRFSDGFDWGLGGKLPGLAGGMWPTGGRRCSGFSARVMWRPDGAAELYVYRPEMAGQYGDRIPLGHFAPGENQVELLFDGGTVHARVNDEAVCVDVRHPTCSGDLLHVFRGGHTHAWASGTAGEVTING